MLLQQRHHLQVVGGVAQLIEKVLVRLALALELLQAQQRRGSRRHLAHFRVAGHHIDLEMLGQGWQQGQAVVTDAAALGRQRAEVSQTLALHLPGRRDGRLGGHLQNDVLPGPATLEGARRAQARCAVPEQQGITGSITQQGSPTEMATPALKPAQQHRSGGRGRPAGVRIEQAHPCRVV